MNPISILLVLTITLVSAQQTGYSTAASSFTYTFNYNNCTVIPSFQNTASCIYALSNTSPYNTAAYTYSYVFTDLNTGLQLASTMSQISFFTRLSYILSTPSTLNLNYPDYTLPSTIAAGTSSWSGSAIDAAISYSCSPANRGVVFNNCNNPAGFIFAPSNTLSTSGTCKWNNQSTSNNAIILTISITTTIPGVAAPC